MQVESVIEFNQVLLKYAKLNQYEGNHYTYYTSCYLFLKQVSIDYMHCAMYVFLTASKLLLDSVMSNKYFCYLSESVFSLGGKLSRASRTLLRAY